MSVNLEYIVKLNADLEKEKLDKIYHVLMTYSFPMNTNPINQAIINALPQRDKELLKQSEVNFIKEKIVAIDSGVDLLTIPKSLYQLYFIMYIYMHNIELPKFDAVARSTSNTDATIKPPIENVYTDDKTMNEFISSSIQNEIYSSVWWKVNHALGLEWGDQLIDYLDQYIEALILRLVKVISEGNKTNEIPSSYLKSAVYGRQLSNYLLVDDKPSNKVQGIVGYFKKIILLEYFEHENYLLYTSATSFDPEFTVGKSYPYCDGMLSGFLFRMSDCSFHYMVKKDNGRAFLNTSNNVALRIMAINKKNIPLWNELFYIPPIPSFLRIAGNGDFFFARSKMPSGLQVESDFLSSRKYLINKKLFDTSTFITSAEEPATHLKLLQEYSRKNLREATAINSLSNIFSQLYIHKYCLNDTRIILKPFVTIDDLINITTQSGGISAWITPSARIQPFLNRYNEIGDALTHTEFLSAAYDGDPYGGHPNDGAARKKYSETQQNVHKIIDIITNYALEDDPIVTETLQQSSQLLFSNSDSGVTSIISKQQEPHKDKDKDKDNYKL